MSRNSAVRNLGEQVNDVEHLQKMLLHVDSICGKYYPTDEDDQSVEVNRLPDSFDAKSLPVPPERFWHWYGNSNAEQYLAEGETQARKYKTAAAANGFELRAGHRVLDFGCSGGRVTRWFADDINDGIEVWGCDIDAAAIEWCQKNMMPGFNFFANSTSPHLPVRDGFYDFIFAGSVFTHIKDMSTAWMLELNRCLDERGIAIFTVTTEHSLDLLRDLAEKPGCGRVPQFIKENDVDEQYLKTRGMFTIQSSPWWLAAIYHSEFFSRRLSMCFDIVSVIPGLKGYQTGFVIRNK